MDFAIAKTEVGKLNALVKKIMQQTGVRDPGEAIRLVNSGEWVLKKSSPKWTVNPDGAITLTLESDGTTGEQWIPKLKAAGKRISDYTKQVLLSDAFKPTKDVIYQITIMPGGFFSGQKRETSNIRAQAKQYGLGIPPLETACLLRLFLADEEIKQLGLLVLVVMSDPVENSDGNLDLLSVSSSSEGEWLDVCWGFPDCRWAGSYGFVFGVSAS